MTTSIAVVGVNGHGRSHVEQIQAAEAAGAVRLTAVADLRLDLATHVRDGVARYPDVASLLDAHSPDVVVVSTPIHTHTEIASAAFLAGADVLLEKPPTADLAEFDTLVALAEQRGRRCQVGFQSLGSAAVRYVRDRIREGRIGEALGFSAGGCWVRTRRYFERAAWAGRRRLGGRVVADGALTNPLAHATATGLAIAGATRAEDVHRVDVDLYRANAIEADDTSSARLLLANGREMFVAVTLCAAERGEPFVAVEGERARITLYYAIDVVVEEYPGQPPLVTRHSRVSLLDNLLAVRAGKGKLCAPLAGAGGFMRLLEAVMAAPDPRAIAPRHVVREPGEDGDERVRIPGVEEAVEQVLRRRRLFRELGIDWAPQC